MKNYEVTFIVDPVLSGDEIKATAQTYVDHLKNEGCTIVHVDEMGLKQLAYPINKRSSGVYFCVEFEAESGALLAKLELAFRRDERIMRFLTVALDKYGVKYNDDKRKGLIGTAKKRKKEEPKDDRRDNRRGGGRSRSESKPAPKKEAPKAEAKAEAPKTEAPKAEAPVKEAPAVATEVKKEEEE